MAKRDNRAALILVLVALIIITGSFLVILAMNMFKGENGKVPDNPPAFGSELKIPEILEDQNADPKASEYVLEAMNGQSIFFENKKTNTYGYNGSYLGPVIKMRKGEQVRITLKNSLGVSTTLHWHGLIVDGDDDGGPHQGIKPGETWTPEFVVDQNAATLWYHPHLMETTSNQVYQGLSGLIYIEDEVSDQLNIPHDYGVNDIPLIVQDRSFNSDGSFNYQVNMMGPVPGNVMLVNGTVTPYFNVVEGVVRFRILNASNSENFEFRLSDGATFYQIASDGGFLSEPVERRSLFLSPSERAEILVDFRTSKEPLSLIASGREVLSFNIDDTKSDYGEIPDTLAAIEDIPLGSNPSERTFAMQSMGISGTINGEYFNMDRIDERVKLGETEIWTITNFGGMMQGLGHPFHVHGTQFQVLSRNGQKASTAESGFKDTVFVAVGEEVKIKVRFTHKGVYMYHCHILEHEDNGMMGQFIVE
ncbi:MAG: multicopper oxidase domain-containing protein [Clostridiaceae bacterium]